MRNLYSVVVSVFCAFFLNAAHAQQSDQTASTEDLIGALLGDTPMIDDLRYLTDVIGGRVTGTQANLNAVEWTLDRLESAGLTAIKEPFQMDQDWSEQSTSVTISGDASFSARAVAKFYSPVTSVEGLSAPLVDVGGGSEADFNKAGASVKGAWVLVETGLTEDIGGLFAEYGQAAAVEPRAVKAGAAGIVFMSSRPSGLLYRFSTHVEDRDGPPVIIIERDEASRMQRLLKGGAQLTMNAVINAAFGEAFESYNVIGEIEGSDLKDEIVIMGAHLDSFALGTGANDNAVNVAIMMDIARQMRALNIQPRRTIRFILWNGEEEGLVGSRRYVAAHDDEMNKHVMAMSVDIGSGRINGFFTNGRGSELDPILNSALKSVKGMGPFMTADEPIVGTDNFDFMISGVANLVASHESATYGQNYHAETDTFDKVDQRQARLNAAIIAAVAMEFANADISLPRHSRSQISRLIETTSLKDQMRTFGSYDDWKAKKRGRK